MEAHAAARWEHRWLRCVGSSRDTGACSYSCVPAQRAGARVDCIDTTGDGSIVFFETAAERESYRPTDGMHVLFTGESSSDGGKTWKLLFGATYATYTKRP